MFPSCLAWQSLDGGGCLSVHGRKPAERWSPGSENQKTLAKKTRLGWEPLAMTELRGQGLGRSRHGHCDEYAVICSSPNKKIRNMDGELDATDGMRRAQSSMM